MSSVETPVTSPGTPDENLAVAKARKAARETAAPRKTAKAKKAPKKAAKKRATKKATAKKTSKKTAKKTSKKAPARKDGLRKPQLRILATLAKAKRPLTRAEVAEKAPCDVAWLTSWLGSPDPDRREANDTKHFPSLVSLKLVKQEISDQNGRDVVVYSITATGKKAVAV